MAADKSMTIAELEDAKSELNKAMAKLIADFEDATSMRIGWIDTVREKDKDSGCCCGPVSCDSDRGNVVMVNVSVDLDI